MALKNLMNKHFYMIFLLFVISAFTPPVFGVEACLVKNKGINFTKDIELTAYKREYLDADWASGEEEKKEKGTYPIYSILIYGGNIHAWPFASEYNSAHLVRTERADRYLIDKLWWPLDVPGKFRDSVKKYSAANVKYYIELQSNDFCDLDKDIVVAIYRDDVKVENIYYRIKEMDPKEVADRIKYHKQ